MAKQNCKSSSFRLSREAVEALEKLAADWQCKKTPALELALIEGVRLQIGGVERLRVEMEELRGKDWLATRVIAWMDDERRGPAVEVFGEGNERELAVRFEKVVADVLELERDLELLAEGELPAVRAVAELRAAGN